MNRYPQYQDVRIYMRGKEIDGDPADPTTLLLVVTSPTGTRTEYTYAGAHIIRESIGVFYYDVDTSSGPGIWKWRARGTGAIDVAAQGTFEVLAADPA